ncbi:type II toxin-antitoxin system VapC family toxin [Neorhizobium lilium]|uniref:Type II toxin-antitoxin system VapC family toxin n=1 Tax=Neorhizobium lilium TaxID=2503024 RepID=A0A3S3SZY5_9HYPH|nr:type II toxin-antitoxin system VapC family toxin [Neorhizobium lilium]RWX78749.1 type II toxin-antitoxin system VapC family toxin [Neorhizobium lilium]
MILIDTHVLIWVMSRDIKLGSKARHSLDTSGVGEVLVSAITPWEIALLDRKGRLPLGREVGQWLEDALGHPRIRLVPLEPAISVESTRLPGEFHSDPADRIIAATARHLGIPLLTADRAILAYGEQGYLRVVDASL